jgi:adenosine deaminase
MRDAIELLGAECIDHGVRAVEAPARPEWLAESGIAPGICPASNLVLKVYGAMAVHPIDRLRRAGVRVSVNTGDPGLLGTPWPDECALRTRHFVRDDAGLRALAATSIDASFADERRKRKLQAQLAAW